MNKREKEMRRTTIMCVLLFATVIVAAQRQTEYNRQGDEAKNNRDFSNAKIWYEEGLPNCDPYSINQLTSIWLADETMRMMMRNVMSRCLECLTSAAELKDTVSINKLIRYYTEGIGTSKNEAKVEFWKDRLRLIRETTETNVTVKKPPHKKVKMDFFLGYSASLYSPYGLTAGGIGKTIGWYLRYRTNMSFRSYTAEYNNPKDIIEGLDGAYDITGNETINMWIGTGGVIVKATPSFYISAGAGYCNRERLCEFRKMGDVIAVPQEVIIWTKYNDKISTFKGLALDLDATFRIGKVLYGSLGCSVLNFEYASANAGIGVFF
ncbi:MAG: hypothetical protein LBG28_05490 [Tannerella sp.]|nr:hypothetical protein [Tannerella sp.]